MDGAQIELRPARPGEADQLSALALRSKGHWGYPPEFLEACRAELTVTPRRCAAGGVTVAVRDGRILGFHVVDGSPPEGELSALFVDPPAIGTGLGARLLRDALDRAARDGFLRLVLDADPGAEGFYAHHGAVRVGEAPSGSIPGRELPRMLFELPGRGGATADGDVAARARCGEAHHQNGSSPSGATSVATSGPTTGQSSSHQGRSHS